MVNPNNRRFAKIWAECVDLWCAERVSEVEIVPYDYSRASNSAWRNRDSVHVATSNPLRSTAYHLALYLLDKPRDLRIAYKLHAFCVNYRLHPDYYVLSHAFSINSSEVHGWWGQNSRHVLPPVEEPGVGFREYEFSRLRDLRHVVPAAAREWQLISEQWVIVRIPDLMLDGSEEKSRWEHHCMGITERRERLEYERLKKKFDGA